jgi:Mg-chelatase subunit ChlD
VTSQIFASAVQVQAHPGLLWFLLIASCVPQAVRAEEAEKSVQALIVFDVSGSMRQSDPNRLSVAAAQLFVNLSQPGDAVGLAAFSERTTSLFAVSSGKDANAKQALQRSLASLQFNGQTTDLAAALEAGLVAFPDQEDVSHRRLVLLLTDGELDLGKDRAEAEAAALARIRNSLIPEYHRRGILLYTIAFTTAADREFLGELAEASAGASSFIADAQTLHQAFSQIFIGTHDAQTFPLEQAGIRIDDSIKELSLVFAKSDPDERITLLTPGQRTVQASDMAEGMTWLSTPAYDLVRMRNPQAGIWQIERPDKTQSGVGIIAESTLNLQVELGATFIETGSQLAIRAFLKDESQVPARIQHEEGQTVTAEVSAPNGSIVNVSLAPQADGSFIALTPLLGAAGKYSMTVTAMTSQLQRQRTRTFKVYPECLQGSVSSAARVKVQVALHSSCPAFKSISIEAEYTAANKVKQRVPLQATQPNLLEADLPSASGDKGAYVNLLIHGESPDEGAFTLTKGPIPLPMVPPPVAKHSPATPKIDHDGVARAMRKLLRINAGLAILGVLGFGVYWLIGRFRRGRA